MKKTATAAGFPGDDRNNFLTYLWTRYIDNQRPRIEFDELRIIQFFERYYEAHPLDQESFYYGIVLYERAFSEADESVRRRMLAKAREVFVAYRTVSGETGFDAVEDRLEDLNEILEEPVQ